MHLFYFSNLFPVLFDRFYCFYLMYASFRSVTAKKPTKKRQNTNPYPDGKFFVDLIGPGILRDVSSAFCCKANIKIYYFDGVDVMLVAVNTI